MADYILVLGEYKNRVDHKEFIKSCNSLFDSLASLGVQDKTYVKPNPNPTQIGIGMRVGTLVKDLTPTVKKQLEKLLLENQLTYSLEPLEGWVEAKDVVPVPFWSKIKILINRLFSEYRYAENPALVLFIFRLEQAIENNNLDEFYKAMTAVLSKVTLPEDKVAMLKEKLFLYNIYYFEL